MNFFKKLKKKLGILAVFGLLFQTVTPIYQNAAFAMDGEADQEETVELTGHEEKTDLSNTDENPEERIESEEEKDPDLLEEATKKEEEKDADSTKEAASSEAEDKETVEEESIKDTEDEKTEVDSRELKDPLVENEPKEIRENIIEDFKLLKEDGTAFEDDELIEVDEDLRFELDWALTNNDHEYQSGDYFKFKLPKELTVHNKIEDGKLGDYGSFEVDLEGNVKLIFNEKIEKESNVKGEFFFDTELKEAEIKSSTEVLEIILNDDITKEITINVKPTSGQAIHKEGQPADGNFNTEEIKWTVDINTTRDSLKNAIVNDPILDGMELDLDSIVLEEVEVDLAGNVVENIGEVKDFTDKSTKEELNLALGHTNKAYRLTFTTIMTEEEKDNEGTKNYHNTVYLNSDDQTEKESGASVSVDRPKSMEKTSSNFNKGDRSVEWTVNANFNKKNLSAGDEITDEFTFTVKEKIMEDDKEVEIEVEKNEIFEIVEEDITIEQVDQFNDNGKPTEKSDATDLFDITVDGNKVTYKLKEGSNKAFVLNYKTKAKDGKIINKDGKIVNSIDLNGNTDTSSQDVDQQVGTKTNAGIDYENKTIDWTITINADKQDLKNFILKDDFAGSGQKLVEDSIKISPENDTASITPNTNLEGFEIDFGGITTSYKITYTTKFTYDFDEGETPNFKNNVDISYTNDGNDYELEIGDKVDPNKQTKSNGAKNGKANNDTKEMTWTVDINYNQLDLTGAEVIDEIADNQSLIDGSMKVYETTIGSGGKVNVGTEVTDQFTTTAEENLVKVDFGNIDQSYRVEFVTKDKDDIYNDKEVYKNTAQFRPGDGKVHELTANVTLPNQGEFLGKNGVHNKEDWTIDWEIDVNKSKSAISDVTVDDDLGSTDAQILLEDSIEVTKVGSDDSLVEGEDYNLTIDGNKLSVNFPGEITDHYLVSYSSYIVAEEDIDIDNEAEITSVEETIVGSVDKIETVSIKFSTGGGSGEGETGSLIINKTENESNRALEGIEFELVKTIGSEEIVVREGQTNADGKLAWKGLKFGDYTLNEVIPDGYLGEESQTVNVSSNEDNNVNLLPIENERETGEAKIIKVDSVTGDPLEGAQFELTNQTTGMSYTLTTENDGVIEKEIPFGEYTVEEINAPEGYRITENIDNITVEIDDTAEIKVENVAYLDVEGQKTWYADDDKELPESITVKLLADGNEIDNRVVTSSDDWKYSFENLDKYNRANEEIDYTIEEVEVDGYLVEKDGYDLRNTQKITINGSKTWLDGNKDDRPETITVELLANGEKMAERDISAQSDASFSFSELKKYDKNGEVIDYTINEIGVPGYHTEINDYNITNLRKDIISVEGEKIWKDEDPSERPDSIDVNLTREVNGEVDEEFSESKTVKADSKGDWTYKFDNLEEFDENGLAYDYMIKEANIAEKYEASVEGYDITNVRVGETELSGTKRWKDDTLEDRPDAITINLLRNKVVIDSKEITADDNWKYEFTELDEYDEDGQYYDYEVKEEQVPGYAPEITGDDITNTRSEKTSIDITKGWLDDDSEERPESVLVHVYQNSELFDTVEVKASKDWERELTGLEAYDEDGQPYEYTIEEKDVDGYESTIDGFNITNLRVGKTEVKGRKLWKDGDESDRPESITVNLLQNDEKIDSKEVKETDNWEYNFESLEAFDDQGVAYDYKIEEEKVDGYESTIDGFDITNLRVGKKEISVNKIWKNDSETVRPTAIQIDLLQNGEVIQTVELSKENDWTHQFNNLEAFDEEGKVYNYTVEEKAVENYETTIKETETAFEITNTYIDPTEPEDPDTPEDPKDSDDSGLPQTGEARNTTLYITGALLILFGLVIGKKRFDQ